MDGYEKRIKYPPNNLMDVYYVLRHVHDNPLSQLLMGILIAYHSNKLNISFLELSALMFVIRVV